MTVYDREARIGGLRARSSPSIHTTPLQSEETWRYIGVDLSDCFVPTGNTRVLVQCRQDNASRLRENLKAYNVERRPEENVDRYRLY